MEETTNRSRKLSAGRLSSQPGFTTARFTHKETFRPGMIIQSFWRRKIEKDDLEKIGGIAGRDHLSGFYVNDQQEKRFERRIEGADQLLTRIYAHTLY